MVGLLLLIVNSSNKNAKRRKYMDSPGRVEMHGKRWIAADGRVAATQHYGFAA
jgi:hypothetical protein